MDSVEKSTLKTISWRIIAILTTFVICMIFTDDISSSFNISVIGAIISTIEYYIHERLWNKFDKHIFNKNIFERTVTIEISYDSFKLLRTAFNDELIKKGDTITLNAYDCNIIFIIKK
ncbi:MAG: DUF2061 domain-containing protein [Candidatus Pacearchaeota archaeon]